MQRCVTQRVDHLAAPAQVERGPEPENSAEVHKRLKVHALAEAEPDDVFLNVLPDETCAGRKQCAQTITDHRERLGSLEVGGHDARQRREARHNRDLGLDKRVKDNVLLVVHHGDAANHPVVVTSARRHAFDIDRKCPCAEHLVACAKRRKLQP
eukprot:Amastigsp_a841789_189.p3 type:complete len:154 gc:universal Amastigsp_a841789_189:862-1323(+)